MSVMQVTVRRAIRRDRMAAAARSPLNACGGRAASGIGLGQVMGCACANHLVALAGRLNEPLPIQDLHLLAATLDEARSLQLAGPLADRWPLHAEHLGQQIVRKG